MGFTRNFSDLLNLGLGRPNGISFSFHKRWYLPDSLSLSAMKLIVGGASYCWAARDILLIWNGYSRLFSLILEF